MQNHQLASVVSVIAQSVPKPRMALIGEHCSQLWMGEADLCTDSIAIAHMCCICDIFVRVNSQVREGPLRKGFRCPSLIFLGFSVQQF